MLLKHPECDIEVMWKCFVLCYIFEFGDFLGKSYIRNAFQNISQIYFRNH